MSGDPRTAEAKVLLKRGNGDARRAFALLEDAHGANDGEAAALLGAFAALGIGRSLDLARGLELTQIAADRGWAAAEGALDALGDVDLARWLAPPEKQVLHQSPRLRTISDFAAPGVCAWLMARAAPMLGEARMFDYSGADAGSSAGSGRTNREAEFDLVSSDLVLAFVRARIAAATRLPAGAMEPTKVLHYAPGQEFQRHFDFIEVDEAPGAALVAQQGQRIVTFLLYLNADYDGGETAFPLASIAHRGAAGDALYFANVDPNGQPDRRSLHAGLAPTRGEKWVLSQWIRDRAFVAGG